MLKLILAGLAGGTHPTLEPPEVFQERRPRGKPTGHLRISQAFWAVPRGTPGRKLVRKLNDECVARAHAKARRVA